MDAKCIKVCVSPCPKENITEVGGMSKTSRVEKGRKRGNGMKSVLISIQPKWCELIASGRKTVEVRKTKPKLETPFKVYVYETKAYDTLFGNGKPKRLCVDGGKVIGEFVCDKITDCRDIHGQAFFTLSCMSLKEWMEYTEGHKCAVYAWHISNLVIYDKPRKLGEFYTKCDEGCENCDFWKSVRVNADEYDMECSSSIYGHRTLKRPPQSWCYVESEVEGE